MIASNYLKKITQGWVLFVMVFFLLAMGGFTFSSWWPGTQQLVQQIITGQKKAPLIEGHDHGAGDDHSSHDHAGHEHAHDAGTALELSEQAMSNIGLTKEFLTPVTLQDYQRTITVPAILKERPGKTRLEVSTPMSGVITHAHASAGEAITSGSLLFELRITAEELVANQTQLLKTIGELEVENKEIARLSAIADQGGIPQKLLLERQYAKDKLEVLLRAQKEALRLQGISEQQIEDVAVKKRLFSILQIAAPDPDRHEHDKMELKLMQNPVNQAGYVKQEASVNDISQAKTPLILQEVNVHKGETVQAGATLAVIFDMSELLIEGRAFEQDVAALNHSAKQGWRIMAILEQAGKTQEYINGLEMLYSASVIDETSRTLSFYLKLPNTIIKESPSADGLKYVEWKYKPGQRLQLRVPVEEWKQQIVLPVDGVVQEGAESFVFLQNGKHFDRVPVNVIYRDQYEVVIKNDGSIFPGDIVARRGAHQMLMALKNKSGGGVDPHAGHNH